jgi:hypothetical protein
MKTKLIFLVCVVALFIGFTACDNEDETLSTSIVLVKVNDGTPESAPIVSLRLGATTTATLTAKAYPKDISDVTYEWAVDGTSVTLSATSGETVTVTAVAEGATTLTVTAGGKTTKVKVNVAEVYVDPIPAEVAGTYKGDANVTGILPIGKLENIEVVLSVDPNNNQSILSTSIPIQSPVNGQLVNLQMTGELSITKTDGSYTFTGTGIIPNLNEITGSGADANTEITITNGTISAFGELSANIAFWGGAPSGTTIAITPKQASENIPALVAGTYAGSGAVTKPMPIAIPEMSVALSVDPSSDSKLILTTVANVMGANLEVAGEITVEKASGSYIFSGTGTVTNLDKLPLGANQIENITITNGAISATGELSFKINIMGGNVVLEFNGQKEAVVENIPEEVAGSYTGSANMTGMMSMTIPGMTVTLSVDPSDDSKVRISTVASPLGFPMEMNGELAVAKASGSYTFTGTGTITNLNNITGNPADQISPITFADGTISATGELSVAINIMGGAVKLAFTGQK